MSLFYLAGFAYISPAPKSLKRFGCKHKNKINVANYCYSVEMIDAEEKNKM